MKPWILKPWLAEGSRPRGAHGHRATRGWNYGAQPTLGAFGCYGAQPTLGAARHGHWRAGFMWLQSLEEQTPFSAPKRLFPAHWSLYLSQEPISNTANTYSDYFNVHWDVFTTRASSEGQPQRSRDDGQRETRDEKPGAAALSFSPPVILHFPFQVTSLKQDNPRFKASLPRAREMKGVNQRARGRRPSCSTQHSSIPSLIPGLGSAASVSRSSLSLQNTRWPSPVRPE